MPPPPLLSFRSWRILFAGLVFLGTSLSSLQAARSITLEWDTNAESDIAGYRLHYGPSSGHYTSTVDVGLATTGTIVGVEAGVSYFIVVTAYSATGVESAPSNEVTFEYPPAKQPTISVANAGTAAQFNQGTEIQLHADMLATAGAIVRVEFFDGATKVGEATTTPFSFLWQGASSGTHHLSAIAYDANEEVMRSTEIPITVIPLQMKLGARLPDGSFHLTVSGAIGRTNHIYVSNDLKEWALLTTLDNTNGAIEVTDHDAAGQGRRFYRVVAE